MIAVYRRYFQPFILRPWHFVGDMLNRGARKRKVGGAKVAQTRGWAERFPTFWPIRQTLHRQEASSGEYFSSVTSKWLHETPCCASLRY